MIVKVREIKTEWQSGGVTFHLEDNNGTMYHWHTNSDKAFDDLSDAKFHNKLVNVSSFKACGEWGTDDKKYTLIKNARVKVLSLEYKEV